MLILAVCIICQVTEMFDQWDHTLQTGNDTEYTFVVLALCAGVAYSLKWFIPRMALPDSQAETILYRSSGTQFFALTNRFSSLAPPLSPPTAALRV
jgi:hypothetical protein